MDKSSRIEARVAEFLGAAATPTVQELEAFLALVDPDIREDVSDACRTAITLQSLFPSRGGSTMWTGKALPGYVLERLIGEGGMGRVYLARQETLGRQVAIKVVRSDKAHSVGLRARFERESKLLATLDHPSIVKVFDAGSAGTEDFFAMEYVEGVSLRDELQRLRERDPRRDGPSHLLPTSDSRSVGRCVRFLAEVLGAIVHAHGRGVFHRDLKPENVLIGEGGRPRIVDFGLASAAASVSSIEGDRPVGTLLYMPPPTRSGHSGAARDLWALGVILYELLTLKRPFDGITPADVVAKLEVGTFDRASTIRPGIPADLDRVIQKALAYSTEDRYSAAAEFEQDLQRFLAGEPVLAGQPNLRRSFVRHLRRYRWRYGSAVLASLAVVVFSLLAIHRENSQSEEVILQEARRRVATTDSKVNIAAIVSRAGRAREVLRRPNVTTRGRKMAEEILLDIYSDARLAFDAVRTRIKAAMGSPPGAALSDYRAPSEPALFDALTEASSLRESFPGLLPDPLSDVLPTLTIEADFPRASEATVTVRPVDLVTGAQGDIVLTSLIPLRSRVVPPGFLMIRVEVAGFGSGEYLRDVARGEHLRLPVNIRSDAEVRSASEWCEVPRGTYRVGQPGANSASLYGEIALRSVGFMIEKFEVQCLHYKQYLIAVKDARRPAAWGDTLQNYRASMDRLPIHGISWLEAQRCAEWRGLRLPTWWEWQLAIRGSQGWFAPWGDEPGDIADKASVCRKPEDGPLHVGSRDGDKSLFGVMDGFGNVREWTALPFLTEIEGRVYPASGSRVTCGYEWFTSNSILSPWLGVTAVREGKPEHPNVGFRCVKVFATDARVVK